MPGQWLGVMMVMLLSATAEPGGHRWTFLELIRLYPQQLTHDGACPDGSVQRDGGCKEETTNRSGFWDRGSTSSPDLDSETAWFWWVVKLWWASFVGLADHGLLWCGTLCASVGIAARWSYWLAVAFDRKRRCEIA